MTPHRHSLRLSRIIRADAATLFRAWTDPEELLRVGGRYRLGMTDPDGRKHVLTHERFTDPARMGRHQEGWTDLLNLLQRHVGGIRP